MDIEKLEQGNRIQHDLDRMERLAHHIQSEKSIGRKMDIFLNGIKESPFINQKQAPDIVDLSEKIYLEISIWLENRIKELQEEFKNL